MTTLWVDGKTVYKIEEMTKSKLAEVLGSIFKGRCFKEHGKQYLCRKLKSIVTDESKLTYEDYK